MFNLVSLIIGFVALVCAVIAFLPFLGWANWLITPLAIIGAAVGMISRGRARRTVKHAPKPLTELHPEFASAMAKARNAKAALDSCPPSAQRDYFEWIADAKQDATRSKRIATAVEWLSEGKRRNWKYEAKKL